MSAARKLLGEAGIYGLAAALTSLVGVVLVPLYTRTFEPSEYSVISLIASTNALTGILIVCALDNSAAVWYWDKREPEDRAKTFSTWFFSSAALGTVVALLLLALQAPFSRVLGGAQYHNVAILIACAQPFIALPRVGNLWFRNERRPTMAVTLALISSITTASACVTFVKLLHWGVAGVAMGQLTGIVVAAMTARVAMSGVLSLRNFEFARARQMLLFSSPLVLSALFAWCMGPAAPYVLTAAGLRADAGLFQVGSSLASVAAFAVFAFCQAWTPFALEISREARAQSIYAIVTEAFLALGLLGTLFVQAFATDLLRLVTGPSYSGAGHAAALLVLAQIIAGLPQIFGISFTIAKSTRPLAWATALGALVTCAGFVLLVPRFERDGAAMAIVLGGAASAAYSFIASQRAYYIPMSARRMTIVVGVAALCGALLILLEHRAMSAPRLAFVRALVVIGACIGCSLPYLEQLRRLRSSRG